MTNAFPATSRPFLIAIDDDQSAAELVVRHGLKCGYDGLASSDPFEAEELVRELAPDLVVIDLHMPGLDGIEMFGRLSRMQVSAKVLIISGHSAEFRNTATKLAGLKGLDVVGSLQKPVGLEVLRSVLTGCLDEHAGSGGGMSPIPFGVVAAG